MAIYVAAGGDYDQYSSQYGLPDHDTAPRKAMLHERKAGNSGILKVTVTMLESVKSCPRFVRGVKAVCVASCCLYLTALLLQQQRCSSSSNAL
jgi:hypothetical protein